MKIKKPIKLILASGSPRRRSLLKAAGYKFIVKVSSIKEHLPKRCKPSHLVKKLAFQKAQSISRKFPDHVVLGADTLVYIKGTVIGKPKGIKDAKRILRTLSGAWQGVYTGVAVCWQGGRKGRSGVGISRVKIRTLKESDINWACKRHLDKAGAYAVQEKKDPFVERIIGDYDNVVGLPLRVVRRLLRSPL